MLLAQQAELQKLTAEVGALKGALATRPVAAAPAAPAPAAPPRASKATYAPPDPSQPLPSSQVLQAEVEDYVQHRFSWAAPPIWLTPAGRVAEEGSGSVLLSFSCEEDLESFLGTVSSSLAVRCVFVASATLVDLAPAPTAAVWSTRRVPAPRSLAVACVLEVI
ncbi:hypothetical protein AURDEDRAFT_162835 [Auricularia subglabra TFB-10046 SS5]|nr:hypothetical protein AURDEDRAFT_162835 [Auricularia subglabra TFB-10046 SS5]